ncbi:MAG: hypothetical protein PF489_15375 [Salinivirgaceae bacterium]|jgi:hypothetical protein|nr:hypothetical protein [Salinivirgaceae bacterium]
MKKINILKNVTIVFTMMVALFTRCKVDDKNNSDESAIGTGTASVDGTISTFSQGLITYKGVYENSEFHIFEISLGSRKINLITQTGIGDVLRLELLVTSSTFTSGRFVFGNDENLSANTLISGYYLLDVNVNTQEAEEIFMVTGGTLNVSVSGNYYELNYDFTMQELNPMFFLPVGDEKTLTGSYSGELIYDDASDS